MGLVVQVAVLDNAPREAVVDVGVVMPDEPDRVRAALELAVADPPVVVGVHRLEERAQLVVEGEELEEHPELSERDRAPGAVRASCVRLFERQHARAVRAVHVRPQLFRGLVRLGERQAARCVQVHPLENRTQLCFVGTDPAKLGLSDDGVPKPMPEPQPGRLSRDR